MDCAKKAIQLTKAISAALPKADDESGQGDTFCAEKVAGDNGGDIDVASIEDVDDLFYRCRGPTAGGHLIPVAGACRFIHVVDPVHPMQLEVKRRRQIPGLVETIVR